MISPIFHALQVAQSAVNAWKGVTIDFFEEHKLTILNATAKKIISLFESNITLAPPADNLSLDELSFYYTNHFPILKPFLIQLFPSAQFSKATQIFVRCNMSSAELSIVGSRPLQWESPTPLKRIAKETWTWITDADCCEYKIIDQEQGLEIGPTRTFKGHTEIIAPIFRNNFDRLRMNVDILTTNLLYQHLEKLMIVGNLEALINLAFIFGQETFFEYFDQYSNQNIKSFFEEHVQTFFPDTCNYKKAIPTEERDALYTYLKKIQKLVPVEKDQAIYAMVEYVKLRCEERMSNLLPKNKVLLNPDVLEKTGKIFDSMGFSHDVERNANHGQHATSRQTVSEMQGSRELCQKVIENTWGSAAAISRDYLRQQQNRNEELFRIFQYKRFGHTLSINGTLSLPSGTSVQLEGFNETFIVPMMLDLCITFYIEFGKDEALFNQIGIPLNASLYHDNATPEKIQWIYEKIHNPYYKIPILVFSGWVWHVTACIFQKTEEGLIRIWYCNSGSDCRTVPSKGPGIHVVEIENEEKITLDFLKRLSRRLDYKHSEYLSLDKIIKELDAKLYRYIPLKEQKGGHCTHKTSRIAILCLMTIALQDFEEAKKLHRELCEFDTKLEIEEILFDQNNVNLSYVHGLKSPCYMNFEKIYNTLKLLSDHSKRKKFGKVYATIPQSNHIELKSSHLINMRKWANISQL